MGAMAVAPTVDPMQACPSARRGIAVPLLLSLSTCGLILGFRPFFEPAPCPTPEQKTPAALPQALAPLPDPGRVAPEGALAARDQLPDPHPAQAVNTSSLAVNLLAPDGLGVSARVRVGGPSSPWIGFTNASGTIRFGDLRPGYQSLSIEDLPFDLVAAPHQASPIVLGTGDGFVDQLLLKPGGNDITYTLLAAAWIEGHVVDDLGHPVGDATVCARLQNSDSHRNIHTRTARDGSFHIQCPPGLQRVNVFLGRDHPWADAARPLPQTVRVNAGETVRCSFVLSREGRSIVGRVLDPDGRPLADLEVLAYYKLDQSGLPEEERSTFTMSDHALRTFTAKDGFFELRGLPEARLGIQVGPEDCQPVGRGRLGMVVPRLLVDIDSSERVDLGTILAYPSRPFRVKGRIQLVDVTEPVRLYAVLQAGLRRRSSREVHIDTRREAQELLFEWSCETPEEEVLLELRTDSGPLAQRVVWPVPDGSQELLMVATPAAPEDR